MRNHLANAAEIAPSNFSDIHIGQQRAAELQINASSARLRSVKSRVTLANPVTSPVLSRMAVMTMLAQKREPSLRTRQPSSSTRSARGGQAQQLGGAAALLILLRKEAREVQAENLVRLVALDALGAGVPGQHVAVAVEQIDGILADALDDGAQSLVVEPQSLLRGALLGGVADEAHDGRAALQSRIGLSMMSTGNSVPSLRRPKRFRAAPIWRVRG